ncbi:hypothetical protein VMCG_06610 [Cytospora schulzeri]|uniref:FAD/NAD(P)-binding domain-containing protein n=1 Tax=Cytospora schulzeri TaxID=448051 RepID=A0A423W6P9_9PEZI|nr:hypothetical protein VMCG_06610 [Valsa malicola]
MEQQFDLVVIGAGWAGLASAKTYHQLHPERSVVILDQNATLGGTWAKERLYPGLKTNNLVGPLQYPDFPLVPEEFGIERGQHIPGQVVHDYLSQYADKFGIADKIRYGVNVIAAEHHDSGGWTVTTESGGETAKLSTARLVVATGLTSEAFLPNFEGQEDFGVPIFHSKYLQENRNTLDTAKSVAVFGGTKSAWDAVYAYASKGIKVNWVIRGQYRVSMLLHDHHKVNRDIASGHGPIWQAPPYVTPLKKWLEQLVHTRLITWFSPCIWGYADGYTGIRKFWHETAIGRAITRGFWWVLGNDVLTLNQYDKHPETAKLKPWSEAFFSGSSFSILNYDTDFFDLVRDGTVKVHIADLASLSPRTVHLSDGVSFETDLLLCSTGWKHVPPMRFLPEGIEKELGLPHVPTDDEPIWKAKLVHKADREILSRFPRLRDQPTGKTPVPLSEAKGLSTRSKDEVDPTNPTKLTPYNLYRFMVPPSPRFLETRDIAFAACIMNFSTAMYNHVQALWITAFFDGDLPQSVVPDPGNGEALERLRYETVLHNRFGRWRYPAGHGAQFPDFVFDSMPYLDLLVGDLGLKVHRKKGWLAEMTEPYGPEDYRDLDTEWTAKIGQSSRGADN